MDYIFLIGRILFGGYFILQGINHLKHANGLAQYAASKGVPSPKVGVVVSGLMILLGGLGVVLGVYTVLSTLLIAAFLIAVSIKMHAFWNINEPQAKMNEKIQFMKNVALLGAALVMCAIPAPWVFSLFY